MTPSGVSLCTTTQTFGLCCLWSGRLQRDLLDLRVLAPDRRRYPFQCRNLFICRDILLDLDLCIDEQRVRTQMHGFRTRRRLHSRIARDARFFPSSRSAVLLPRNASPRCHGVALPTIRAVPMWTQAAIEADGARSQVGLGCHYERHHAAPALHRLRVAGLSGLRACTHRQLVPLTAPPAPAPQRADAPQRSAS